MRTREKKTYFCLFLLKEEAKVALALGAKMARMQVQIERRNLRKKKSPLFDIVRLFN